MLPAPKAEQAAGQQAHPSAPSTHQGEHHWGYSGAQGPGKWGSLDPSFSACGLGKHQSPIDVHDPQPADLPAIVFHYTRQHLREPSDLSEYSQAALNTVALRLNQRPRKTLGSHCPADTLDGLSR